MWSHNDSGDDNIIYALNLRGEHLGIYTIEGVDARDWEDMAVGPGPDEGESYIYIGEIGDNYSQYDEKYIYRIPEPDVNADQEPVETTLTGVETITYQYLSIAQGQNYDECSFQSLLNHPLIQI